MPSPLPDDPRAHWRARRLAIVATWVIALGSLYMIAVLVMAFIRREPAGAAVFFAFGVTEPFTVALLVHLWRRERAARAAWFDASAGRGERAGVPELDESARPHQSLNGEVDLPPRW